MTTTSWQQNTFVTAKGQELETYLWMPGCGPDSAKGIVFLLHGLHGHACFDFLDADEKGIRNKYEGSIVESLNKLDLIVFGHDHPGHGLSGGLRGYWDSFDVLRDAALETIDHAVSLPELKLSGKPKFGVGMSMGGTIAIEMARVRPTCLDGYVLLSPAVKPPDDMFGLWGRFLHAVSGAVSKMTPKLRVLKLPLNEDEDLKQQFVNDPMTIKDPLRARPGREFIRVYSEIEQNASSIKFPAVVVFFGEKDPIVSSHGIQGFIDAISSEDKAKHECKGTGHEVLYEAHRDEVRQALCVWIKDRV